MSDDNGRSGNGKTFGFSKSDKVTFQIIVTLENQTDIGANA